MLTPDETEAKYTILKFNIQSFTSQILAILS